MKCYNHKTEDASAFSVFSFFLLVIFINSVGYPLTTNPLPSQRVVTGAENLMTNHIHLLKGKRIGVVTNHTALFANGVHLVDSLFSLKSDFTITTLFGPEHGIRGDAGAGEKIENSADLKTGIPVFSLYGKYKKPTPEMLKDVNLLIFDIQDVGSRFYTYISTLYYILEAAGENNIPVLVLDRPNPAAPLGILGPIREPDLTSFVGIAPITIAHAMTIGELAKYYTGELIKSTQVDLTVIPMLNYKHSLYFFQTGLPFTKPSPNIMEESTMLLYPGTCLFEGTNISEGRGTYYPFLQFGAPYLNADKLLIELNKYGYEDIKFESVQFKPIELPNIVSKPKYKDELCFGIRIHPSKELKSDPVLLTLRILHWIAKNHPHEFSFREKSIDILSGSTRLKGMIKDGVPPETILAEWLPDMEKFKQIRNGYLIYD